MVPAFVDRFEQERRIRRLGSRDRSGRYSRKVILEKVRDFVKVNWGPLLFLLFFPGVFTAPVAYFMKGTERWIYVGAACISGPWLVAIFVILWTGVGNTMMGLEGENFTAEAFKKYRSKKWILINGMKTKKDSDIDHVLIGPAGVFVIETKWSYEKWPLGEYENSFMWERLMSAISQARINRDRFVFRFGKDLQDIRPRPICVLWSSEYSAERPVSFQYGGVQIVFGPDIDSWMETLSDNSLDQSQIDHLSKVIDRQVLSRDEAERSYSSAPLPSVNTFMTRTILVPFFSFMMAFTGMYFATQLHSIWTFGIALVLSTLFGLWMRGRSFLRLASYGWLASCSFYYGLSVVVAIQVLTR